ncbi:MAG: glycosyltransferase family 4 protein [Candidatus Binatia bacterium]
MRIVQVVQGLPPESLGGTEMYVSYLSRELMRRGHEVRVFSRAADPHKEEYEVEDISLEGLAVTRINNTLRHLDHFSQSYTNSEIARHFGAFLDAFSPQVVHFHHLMYLSTTCIQEVTRRRIPVVMTLHDYWLICQRGRFLKPDLSLCPGQNDEGCARCFAHLLEGNLVPVYRRLKPMLSTRSWLKDRLRHLYGKYVTFRHPSSQALEQIHRRMAHVQEVCREVTLFLAPSQFLRAQFLAFGIPAHKITYAECGLPLPEMPAERKGTASPLVFAYIGVMDPVKGVHLLVEAFQGITNAELRLYGGETDYAAYPDRERFLNQIDRSPHIRLMGRYDNCEIGRILSQVDVVIVPSIWYENAPLVIREAFLARKPVITANLGGMRELVQDEVTGLLFRPREVVDLRSKINRFIADPELVGRLAQNIPAVKSIAEDAQELEEEYLTLCKGTP